MGRPKATIDDLLKKIKKTPSGCWLYCGFIGHNGYGQYAGDFAHRWSYKHFVGPIPNGMCVCHKCDCPSCVNPDHLFLGTNKDNTRDAMKKGRMKPPPYMGKVVGENLDLAITLSKNGMYQWQIAELLKVDQSTICKALKRGVKCAG